MDMMRVVTLLLLVAFLTTGSDAKEDNSSVSGEGANGFLMPYQCPGIPEMGVQVSLHLSGQNMLPFSQAKRDVVLATLVDFVKTSGKVKKFYVQIKSVTEIYNSRAVRSGRKLADSQQSIELLLLVMVTMREHGPPVGELLATGKFCQRAVKALNEAAGESPVETCKTGDLEHLYPAGFKKNEKFNIHWVWIFFSGCFLGACLMACLLWVIQKFLFLEKESSEHRKKSEISIGPNANANPTFDLSFKRSNRGSIRCGDRFRQLTEEEEPLWKELTLNEISDWRDQIIMCNIYFEEIVPNSISSRNHRLRTRVLHRKLKVRDVPMCRDKESPDPIFLLSVSPRYCLHVDLRKAEDDSEQFPFGCIDHIVIACPDGSTHRLPVVTLTAGNNDQSRHRYRVAAVWDPPLQGSEVLFNKPTSKAESIPIKINIAFRVFGYNVQGRLYYVTRTVNVRMRAKGEIRHVDRPFKRPEEWSEKAPLWARGKGKGVITILGLTPPLDPLMTM